MFVSRARFDAMQAERDAANARWADLLEKYHALKLVGAVVRPEPTKAAPPVDPTERVMAQARHHYVERVTAEHIAQGTSAAEAREIATYLADALDNLSPVEFS